MLVSSKLDAKAGYWAIHLDEDSQLLTTFRTPFGRYCWQRLPFGLSTSQDVFQARMDKIMEGLNGVVSIADDVCVHGRNAVDRDANQINLMNRAAEKGLVFSSDKCFIKQESISFYGNAYIAEGIKPDPTKVRDIQNMPALQCKEDLQRFLGMMTYLSQYIPRLAENSHMLLGLLKKDTTWTLDSACLKQVDELKEGVSENACLKYYNTTRPLRLEVDASKKGLGLN